MPTSSKEFLDTKGNYRVWIHSETCMCHDTNIQSNAPNKWILTTRLNHLVSLAKWLSVRLQTKCPVNICLDEDVFKKSSRCLDQDQYICLGHTSSRRLPKAPSRHLQDVLPRGFQNVFKASSRRLSKSSSRYLQDAFKTSSRHLQDAFQKLWRRLQDILLRCLQDVFKTYQVILFLLTSSHNDCNWTRTQNHLVLKRTLNYLAKLASLAKWLSVRLRTKWFWVRVQLQSLHLQISCLLQARSSLTFRQL